MPASVEQPQAAGTSGRGGRRKPCPDYPDCTGMAELDQEPAAAMTADVRENWTKNVTAEQPRANHFRRSAVLSDALKAQSCLDCRAD